MKIAVSYLSSKYSPKETIKLIDASNADYIHVDLMDGKFVENKNFTIGEVTKLLGNVIKPLDIHLMTLKPEKYFVFSAFNALAQCYFSSKRSISPRSILPYIIANSPITGDTTASVSSTTRSPPPLRRYNNVAYSTLKHSSVSLILSLSMSVRRRGSSGTSCEYVAR